MPREAEGYRPELEQILTYFPGRRVLSMKEVMEYTGKSRHWLLNRGIRCEISAVQLALLLTKLNQ